MANRDVSTILLPFDLEWARDIIAQCRRAGVKVAPFFKQAGAQVYDSDLTQSGRSESLHFRNRKGGDMSEWPSDLRVREFPEDLKEDPTDG